VWVDEMGTVYVAEECNQRVTRWPQGETRAVVVVGGNDSGNATNQLNCPVGLSFDQRCNMSLIVIFTVCKNSNWRRTDELV
jgi:hypothetical protein